MVYLQVLQYEVPLIRAAAKEAGCTDVKLTLIVANRFHNVRLIPSNVSAFNYCDIHKRYISMWYFVITFAGYWTVKCLLMFYLGGKKDGRGRQVK